MIEKDVMNQLSLVGQAPAGITFAIEAALMRQFVARQYKMSSLLANVNAGGIKRSEKRNAELAGMQAYTLMYQATIDTVRGELETFGATTTAINEEKEEK